MASVARLFALLNLLQERGWVQGQEIAARLKVEPRTVRRDLARLSELGLPVESRRGRYGGYRIRPGFPQDLDTPTLLRLAEATRHGRRTRITYAGRGKAERERFIDPYGLVVNRMHWYVPAFDHDSGELRTFRVDRIRTVGLAGPAYPPPPGFDPVTAVADSLARAPWRWEVVLLARASPQAVRRRLPEWMATLTRESQDTVRVTLRAERLDGAARLLAGIGLPFELVAPDELRPILAAHAQALLAAAAEP